MSDGPQIPTGTPEGAHLDLAGDMSYGDYLALDQVLNGQGTNPVT